MPQDLRTWLTWRDTGLRAAIRRWKHYANWKIYWILASRMKDHSSP